MYQFITIYTVYKIVMGHNTYRHLQLVECVRSCAVIPAARHGIVYGLVNTATV
jgi:hypothetical protein